jgi:hypothetical protein
MGIVGQVAQSHPSTSGMHPLPAMSYQVVSTWVTTGHGLCGASIHVLSDNLLLSIFSHVRQFCQMKIRLTMTVGTLKVGGWSWQACASLYHQRSQCGGWSYKLARVCRRWQYFVLTSAPYLDLSLLCMCGTLIADILAHSPPFPLVIHRLANGRNMI